MNKAVFLDRDGVININKPYISHISGFIFQEGIFSLLRKMQELGYLIIVITNQSGISRGYFTRNDLKKIHTYMLHTFNTENIKITAIYYCSSYNDNNYYRKPNPGMIIRAKEKYNINLKNSILIGDKMSDIMAGKRAGIGCNILINKNSIYNFCVSDLVNVERILNSAKTK